MSVTVLLPVYNGAATLRQAIESILVQDAPDFELLVIDDHSTDDSTNIAASFAKRDERVRLIVHDQNTGLATSLNEGLELAQGELVARMDQDDESLPQRLRVQQAFMEGHPSIVVAGSDVLHMGASPMFDRLVELPHAPGDIASRLQQENCLYHPAVIMRREVVVELGGYRDTFRNAEDYDLWLRIAREHDLGNVAEPLLRYRFSVGGMTLGRKWEQLYYVHLAQAASRNPALAVGQLDDIARASLADVDRRSFMRHVASATVDELVQLRLWSEASALTRQFAPDVGRKMAIALLARVNYTRARSYGSRTGA
jgi:glycosyltransferase involved in cell wall biosynthesis